MKDRYASLKEGLVGAWIPSVSGSGFLLPDVSGRNNHGTLTNMASNDWVSSQYGRALDFDGSNDYVEVGNLRLMSGTLSMWLKPTTVTGDLRLFSQLTGASNQAGALSINQNLGETGSVWVWDGSTWQRLSANNTLAAGAWQNLCVIYTGTNATSYVNGVVRNTATTAFSFNGVSAGIGAKFLLNYGNTFPGQLDDIRIYNRALSESEIRILAQRPGIGLTTQRRTVYYELPAPQTRRRNHLLIGNMF